MCGCDTAIARKLHRLLTSSMTCCCTLQDKKQSELDSVESELRALKASLDEREQRLKERTVEVAALQE